MYKQKERWLRTIISFYKGQDSVSDLGMVMPKRLTPVSFDPWIINVTVLNAGQAGGSALCK